MACTKNRSRIWVSSATLGFFGVLLLQVSELWGAFASQFSLSVGEEYSDNIFFSKEKESDFVTLIVPRFSFYHAPVGETVPTLSLNIAPKGQIYARHSEINNFGDDFSINGGYTFHYSPRLTFNFSQDFKRQGDARLTGLTDTGNQLPLTPTAPFPPGSTIPNLPAQSLRDYTPAGHQLSNNFAFQGNYRYRPNISISSGYTNSYAKFLTRGGSDLTQTFSVRGIYNWKNEHNLHAGYSLSIVNPRNGDDGVIHDFDFGDDYFTSQVYKVQITPTLNLAASTGISINTSGNGPSIANNTTLIITKLWEKAFLSGGVRKGLTPTFGISGVSDTTDLFANFSVQLAERLNATATSNFAFYDTDQVNFRTFQTSAGIHYLINSWLSSGLYYSYRSIYGGSGATNTGLLEKGTVSASNVFLSVTARFDIWPNTGLSRSEPFSGGAPVLRTPFPLTSATPAAPFKQPAVPPRPLPIRD